ncbi:hypothetical protein TNIN_220091 [Trichonephila inaurata madagascariensis]|uniref:Uncharacterized protein n=1 Tax=Trichonephila inaurata madagascariensis TaxID=2747483 RepID=A0A8X6XXZ5_9ARAC|nr:hypothetical protein TNIN_220091 [Trichonephila inaurata madagascariensis]
MFDQNYESIEAKMALGKLYAFNFRHNCVNHSSRRSKKQLIELMIASDFSKMATHFRRVSSLLLNEMSLMETFLPRRHFKTKTQCINELFRGKP